MNEQQYTDNANNLEFYSIDDHESYSTANYYPPADSSPKLNYEASMSSSCFWSAFGTGGFPEEPSLLEELGVDLYQIKDKAVVVLNPFKPMDRNLIKNPDLAGPLLFCFVFGFFLILSGKSHFEYIYSVGILGSLSIYLMLNLMSENGIDGYCTVSVLGYCLLPIVILSSATPFVPLSGPIGIIVTMLLICWCTYSSSHMFVTVLSMNHQMWLVAYPVALFYTTFALMTVY